MDGSVEPSTERSRRSLTEDKPCAELVSVSFVRGCLILN